ncbi:MAG: hypothetical protein IV090_17455 [Candidatus Sericytochromatia bacterium]|nr:hypothetical protein [Candidatus Sericytochromatia bacterium]
MINKQPIQWIPKDNCIDLTDSELSQLKSLLKDSPLLQFYPAKSKVKIQVEISKRIPNGSDILNATIWNLDFVDQVKSPEGFPRLPLNSRAEGELLLVEILHITKNSGGMGSYFGYYGYYYSVIVDLNPAKILDVRGQKMT